MGSNLGLWNWQSDALTTGLDLFLSIFTYVYISDLDFMVRSAVMVGVEDIQVGLPHVLQNRFFFTTLKLVFCVYR
jgi:hypothetical protein